VIKPTDVPNLIVPSIRASADLNAIAQLVGPAEVIRAQLGLVLGGEVVEAYHKECIVHSLETLSISRVRSEQFAEGAPDFAVLGREQANGGSGDLLLLNIVCIGTDSLEVEEDLPLVQHRPVLRIKHVKIVYMPIGQVSTEKHNKGGDGTHRTGPGG